MAIDARAVCFVGVDRVEVRPIQVREPGEGEVLIETLYSCVSPGTELRCLRGRQPDSPPHPWVSGYSACGRVLRSGKGVSLAPGTPVFHGGTRAAGGINLLWGGHSSHAVRAAKDVIPLPEGLDPFDASIGKLAAIAYHGTRVSRPADGDEVAVVGLGVLGQLSARLHAAAGARVVGGDLSAWRVGVLRGSGVEAVETVAGLTDAFKPLQRHGADVVVDATGAPAVLLKAIALAKTTAWGAPPDRSPRYLIQGSYEETFTVPYQEAFRRELSFHLTRDNGQDDIAAVLGLIAAGKLQVRDLLGEARAVERAPETYAELRDPDARILTAAFRWAS